VVYRNLNPEDLQFLSALLTPEKVMAYFLHLPLLPVSTNTACNVQNNRPEFIQKVHPAFDDISSPARPEVLSQPAR
jgi:hypothetical protein